jgi:hypothetical protein
MLKNTFTVAYILILLVFVSSCAPKIVLFEAIPRNICAGHETEVSWKVTGLGLLTADPPTNNTGPVTEEDSIIFTPLVDTTYSIIASRNGKETQPNHQYVYVLNDDEEIEIGDTAKLIDTKLVAIVAHHFQEWGDLTIENLTNSYERSLWVVYKDKEIEIPANPKNCNEIHVKPEYCQEFKISDIKQFYITLNREEISNLDLQPTILQTSGNAVCKNKGE